MAKEEHLVMGQVPLTTRPTKRKTVHKKPGTLADAVSDCVFECGIDAAFHDGVLDDYLFARSIRAPEGIYIRNIIHSELAETIVDRIEEGSDGIPGRKEVLKYKGDSRLPEDRLYEITKEFATGLRQGLLRSKERFGKKICNTFKEMRREFAAANGIDYFEDDCTNPEPCKGTCPYCEGKNKELLGKADELSRTQEIVYPQFHVDSPLMNTSGQKSSAKAVNPGALEFDMGEMTASEEEDSFA